MKRYSFYHDMELYRRGRIDISEEKIRNIRSLLSGKGEYRTFSDEEKVSSIFRPFNPLKKVRYLRRRYRSSVWWPAMAI